MVLKKQRPLLGKRRSSRTNFETTTSSKGVLANGRGSSQSVLHRTKFILSSPVPIVKLSKYLSPRLLLIMFGDMDNLRHTISDSKDCPILFTNSERIQANRFRFQFFGIEAGIRRIQLEETFLFSKFIYEIQFLQPLLNPCIKRCDQHIRETALMREGTRGGKGRFLPSRKLFLPV